MYYITSLYNNFICTSQNFFSVMKFDEEVVIFIVYRACKHLVYPNQKQERLFNEYLGHSRFIH